MSKLALFLAKLAEFEYQRAPQIFLISIILTLFLAVGVLNVSMQTDISKELPQDLPIIKLQREISERFGSGDMILVLIQLDKQSTVENAVVDIRDPRVISCLLELQALIEKEHNINAVFSIASLFKQEVPRDIEGVKMVLSQVPNSKAFFNRDYSATILSISGDFTGGEERIKSLVSTLQADVDSATKPPGVKMTITGMAPIRVTMMGLLREDAVYTTSVAGIIVLLLLTMLTRSLTKPILIFIPLLFSVTWTLGTMGWLGIPLSIATVAVGAMIIGLGVEYGAFLLSRYEEERKKGKSQKESLLIAIPGVGSAISGSAATTMIGFLALQLVSMPMIQQLGLTLTLGIFYCWLTVLIVNPVFIVLEERFAEKIRARDVNWQIGF
ncbi:MAG: MMPL family transporter [Methanocellales archaeon]